MSGDECCPICTEDIQPGSKDVVYMPKCKHAMHSVCFGEYMHHQVLQYSKQTEDVSVMSVDIICPICRNVLLPVKHREQQVIVALALEESSGDNDDADTIRVQKRFHAACMLMTVGIACFWIITNIKFMLSGQ